jgi:hypothetical protein
MKACAICGKRIWSSAVSIPEKGDYHYECAKETGVLLSLEAAREAISKIADEIKAESDLLHKREAEGANRSELGERIQRMHDNAKYLDTLKMVLIRRKQESLEEERIS